MPIKTVDIPIDKLIPYEKNAKLHDEKQIYQIANSLLRFGWKQPVVVDKDNVIIVGHGRVEGAKIARKQNPEFDKAPCVIADDLSEDEIKAYRLADNKLNESPWDIDLVNEELTGITELDMSLFGFDISELVDDDVEIVEDDYKEELPEEPKAKLGDIYELGKHRVICGDCTDKTTIEKLFNGNIADIAFTSPPYNVGFTPSEIGSGKSTKYNGNDDNKSEQEYIAFLNSYLRNALAFSKYVFMNVQSVANNKIALIDVLYENKDIYADTIIWDKKQGQPAMCKNVLNSAFEYIHIFSEKANRVIGTIEFRGTNDNILHLLSQRNNEYSDIHNATFSIEFASWFISRFAKESVFDSFGGTGTTLIACEQLNKKCYMSELEPKYVDVIIDRWEKFTGQKAVKLN